MMRRTRAEKKGRTTRIRTPATNFRKARPTAAEWDGQSLEADRSGAAVLSELNPLRQQVADLSQRLDSLALQLDRALDCQDSLESTLDEFRELLRSEEPTRNKLCPYKGLVRRVQHLVRQYVPRHARLLVISKGDPELVRINGRQVWHFPRNVAGEYAGYHLACDLAAIAHLEFARAEGAEYLVVPQTAFWWLDHYAGFRRHLDQRYQRIVANEDTAVIYSLRAAANHGSSSTAHELLSIVDELRWHLRREPAILDCHSGLALAENLPQLAVFQPPPGDRLPYLDKSVDLVVTPSDGRYAPAEARRVASIAVVTPHGNGNGSAGKLLVDWVERGHKHKWPKISIIVWGFQDPLNQACLRSLSESLPDNFEGEVIIVDSTSRDDCAAAIAQSVRADPRMSVIRRRSTLGWADDCRHASGQAKGEILICLKSDVLLLPRWLPPLLDVFRNYPDAGAVGGRLISPAGNLQAAGGLVFRDGSATDFGSGDFNPEAVLYNHVREVDYCSALLATRRSVWEELIGFDSNYGFGNYAEIDFCLRVRGIGYRVYYQPEAAVVLRSSDLAGQPPSVAEGNDSNERSQARFVGRWMQELSRHPSPPEGMAAAWAELAIRTDDQG